jgi:hypothetical protein
MVLDLMSKAVILQDLFMMLVMVRDSTEKRRHQLRHFKERLDSAFQCSPTQKIKHDERRTLQETINKTEN